jgi:ABC-type multidrug transport system permease subunit
MSYPAPPPASPPPASSSASPAPSAGGFFNDLFDIRFTRFVSLRLISIVYILILVVATLVALGAIFTGFALGVGAGIFYLILAALLWVVYVVLARVGLEAFAVLFRIHDDTSRIAEALAGARPTPPPGS